MSDEWVCKDCGQATNEDPGGQPCLACGGEMINIGEVDDDLKTTKDKPTGLFDDDDMDVTSEKSDEFDLDFEEEPDLASTKESKKKK